MPKYDRPVDGSTGLHNGDGAVPVSWPPLTIPSPGFGA